MAELLLVPMHVDAIQLSAGQHCVMPAADFSKLPWVARDAQGAYELNPQNAFLGATVGNEARYSA